MRYADFVFDGIDVDGQVLDVGGGSGMLSFYAYAHGAEAVVCLEPVTAGSHPEMLHDFRALAGCMGSDDRVRMVQQDVREHDPGANSYDLLLLHNSINHIDESACANLGRDDRAWDVYEHLVEHLTSIASETSHLVLADCSPDNLFGQLGVPNPFAPTINWSIHQPPEVWRDLFAMYGWRARSLRWSGIRRLGIFGFPRALSYATNSHFVLTMTRSVEE